MEPEDISGILEVNLKVSGAATPLTYTDLVRNIIRNV
jgi:hypothetical protein